MAVSQGGFDGVNKWISHQLCHKDRFSGNKHAASCNLTVRWYVGLPPPNVDADTSHVHRYCTVTIVRIALFWAAQTCNCWST